MSVQFKEDEMGREGHVAQIGEKEYIWDFCWKARRKQTTRKT
jgi:hypothetical protein